jgi:signal transduction histidine kinase
MIQDAKDQAEQILAGARSTAKQATTEMIQDAKDQAEQILAGARSTAKQTITVGTHSEETPPFSVEEDDFADPVKPMWQQATALVSLRACGAMTGFAFAHGTADDIPEDNPMVAGNHREEKDAARDWTRLEQRRVFLSHTSELLDSPELRSCAAAVEAAISAGRPVIVDTADFPVAGLARYGSALRDKPGVSYTEPEFGTATDWFRGRQAELGLLAEYMTGSGVMVVTAPTGSGKTAMLSRMLQGLEVGRNPDKEQVQLAHALARHLGPADAHWAASSASTDGAWHVLHFIGHGDFGSERDKGMLVLTREDGRADLVAAHRVADLLRQGRPIPRLVVLNSCFGAAAGASDLFSGTAAVVVHEEFAGARQQAEQNIADAHREAGEALEQAAEMVRDARGKAEQIISDAHKKAEQIITAARNQQVHPTAEAGLTHTELEISRPPAEPLYRLLRRVARRSQSLLHRQLTLLDQMERRASDPEALDDLFRLDHLTARMRRHAEGLIILAGAPPGRGWSSPVRMVDVMRGAIAEVEDYARVSVATRSQAALAGSAVADAIHLLAELIENATTFSPPSASVRVSGDTVANEFAIEVEDRGLGMSPGRLAELNERLANPLEFNPADSEQLGLFVVSQLAKRHGIRVMLKASPYGGTVAIVLIPRHLVVADEAFQAGLPGEPGVAQLTATGNYAAPSA